jgi:hypothetical protein
MAELERCWFCHKICERPWNPPDINPEDMCQCSALEEIPTDRELIEEGFEELKEMLRERRHAGN